MGKRSYSGATCNSRQNIQTDAGAYFKNFYMETDVDLLADQTTYNALVEQKGIGATQGGGNFSAVPTTRQIPIDGSDPITVFDSWAVTMTDNILELRPDSFEIALGTGFTTVPDGELGRKYKLVQARRQVSTDDYIDNITWIGSLLGYEDPVIIQIFNALGTSGLVVNTTPNGNAVLAVTFTSSVDLCTRPELGDNAPFAIYYPLKTHPVTFAANNVQANGITAIGTITPTGDQPENLEVTVEVSLIGTAAAAGTQSIGLSSTLANISGLLPVQKTVTAGQTMTDEDDIIFTFTMPLESVNDLTVTNTFNDGTAALTEVLEP